MRLFKNIWNFVLKIFTNSNEKYINQIELLIDRGKIIFGQNTMYENLVVHIRNDVVNKAFLKVGNESLVNGNYFFENGNGEIIIGDRVFIGGGKFITINKIDIGNDVMISWGCTFMDNNAHSLKWSQRKEDVRDWKKGIDENKIGLYKNWKNVDSAPIIIKDKCWIGFEVVVLKGVTIGEGAVIGSRSVVTKNVPDWTIVAGNPARIIKEIPETER